MSCLKIKVNELKTIKKLVLKNFKRFQNLELDFDSNMNLLIGDNEAGKSTILLAVDLIISANITKVESIGLETLFNKECICQFKSGNRDIENLPEILIEIYFGGFSEHDVPNLDFDGVNNSLGQDNYGMKLICKPRDDYLSDIKEILQQDNFIFPFEYYSIMFKSFADQSISPYKKPLKHVLIDNTQINNDYVLSSYTRAMYAANSTVMERNNLGYKYRKVKSDFRDDALNTLNDKLTKYKFDIRSGQKSNLESEIIITEDNIPIGNKGRGKQCFIKTEFALQNSAHAIDLVLIEEPENHLSHIQLKKLVEKVRLSNEKQIIIATHSSFISTRLNLNKVIMLSNDSHTNLNDLSPETSKFFMKSPDNNILELALSKKTILVEGNSEFILMEAFYKNLHPHSSPDSDGIQIISIGGTSFKRYLDIAKLLNIKIAVIRDNDGDYQTNCIDCYEEYLSEYIKVFYEGDNNKSTFELCVYDSNKDMCESEFGGARRTLSVQEYMCKNKTEVAFSLLVKHQDEINTPNYIRAAIEWIRE
jgi:putative ATP-dependent endonuclease of OLD family